MKNRETHELHRKGGSRAAWQAKLAEYLQTHLQASLPMDFQKLHFIRFANALLWRLSRRELKSEIG